MQPARRAPTHIDDSHERPVVRGTDIKVSQIASEVEHLGMTADDVVAAHPHLTLAQVHAALSYYYDHQEIIQREWKDAGELIAALQRKYPGRPEQEAP